MAVKPKVRAAWHPYSAYSELDIAAVQSLARGEATPDQQKRALDLIVVHLAQTYDEPFDPASARTTDYVLGRRSVGLQLVKLLKLNPGMFRKEN